MRAANGPRKPSAISANAQLRVTRSPIPIVVLRSNEPVCAASVYHSSHDDVLLQNKQTGGP
jgi:hypothetical protein